MPQVVLITGPQDINKYLPYITGTVEVSEQWGGGGGGGGGRMEGLTDISSGLKVMLPLKMFKTRFPSLLRLVYQWPWYVPSCLWNGAYKTFPSFIIIRFIMTNDGKYKTS